MCLFFVQEVLYEKHDADVPVMRTFGKQIGHRFIGVVHQIVEDEQNGSVPSKSSKSGKPRRKSTTWE